VSKAPTKNIQHAAIKYLGSIYLFIAVNACQQHSYGQ